MNRYTTGGKVPKCGSVDSIFFGDPNGFENAVKKHRQERENKHENANKILDSFINQDTFQEDNFQILLEEMRNLKKEYGI